MPNPADYQDENEWMSVCVPNLKDEGKSDDEALAACSSMWKGRGENAAEASMDFVFSELSDAEVKAIDGLAAGSFVSRTGEEVTFNADELDTYVVNTRKVIESTKTEKGEIVGLPIDLDAHDHRGGAGWIVGLELDKTRNIIRFLVKWTEEGIHLIGKNIRRFFSPSVNTHNKVILGGSMTNWPATRGKMGETLLRPLELSQYMKEISMNKTIDDVLSELEGLRTDNKALADKVAALSAPQSNNKQDESITPEMADFIANTDGAEKIGKEAQELAMNAIKDAKRKDHVKEFVAKVVGGTPERPFGIPVKSSALAAALLSMPDKQRDFIEGVIMKMYEGAIDYAERGFNSAEFARKSIPPEFRDVLKLWVDSGRPAAQWFAEVGKDLGLGDPQDYNLREFAGKDKE